MILSINEKNILDTIINILNNDGLVILPCDTIYGIIGKVGHSELKIRNLKGRGETKPFIQLHHLDFVNNYIGSKINEELLKFWPGPLTLIVSNKDKSGKIGIRVPKNKLLEEILLK